MVRRFFFALSRLLRACANSSTKRNNDLALPEMRRGCRLRALARHPEHAKRKEYKMSRELKLAVVVGQDVEVAERMVSFDEAPDSFVLYTNFQDLQNGGLVKYVKQNSNAEEVKNEATTKRSCGNCDYCRNDSVNEPRCCFFANANASRVSYPLIRNKYQSVCPNWMKAV